MENVTRFDEINSKVIAEFRETGGKAGGRFEGAPLLLPHHVGAKSGARRITPLVPVLVYVFAGQAQPPASTPVFLA